MLYEQAFVGQLIWQPKYTKKSRYWHKYQSKREKVKIQCEYERESCHKMVVQIPFLIILLLIYYHYYYCYYYYYYANKCP